MVEVRRDAVLFIRSLGVTVGDGCNFLGANRATFGSEPYLVSFGDRVEVTSGVKFITHDGGVWVFRKEYPDLEVFGPITVGDNVMIGTNAIIMPGVTIGSNSVIGAGSVVTRDVPSNAVVAGTPAKFVRSVDQYRDGALAKGTHFRGLDPEEKKRRILEHFGRESL
ncbi:acyltransferase [Nocardioides dongxiaopingii]|uniref:acyltransferase n=1 Tax=Nocardioides dongxiaopingii TaxID=2576036 RepID=UPI001FE52A82|nr:acyltransferase [Nocardioides dongxiaopingii]